MNRATLRFLLLFAALLASRKSRSERADASATVRQAACPPEELIAERMPPRSTFSMVQPTSLAGTSNEPGP